MMFNKAWAYFGSLLTIFAGFIGLFKFIGKAKTNEIKAQSEEAAREYERAGYEASREGVKKENETITDDKPAKRGRFT